MAEFDNWYCNSAIEKSSPLSNPNRAMEEEQRLELINLAIRRLIDEENNNKKSSDRSSVCDRDEPDDRTLLRNLLSQVRNIQNPPYQKTSFDSDFRVIALVMPLISSPYVRIVCSSAFSLIKHWLVNSNLVSRKIEF